MIILLYQKFQGKIGDFRKIPNKFDKKKNIIADKLKENNSKDFCPENLQDANILITIVKEHVVEDRNTHHIREKHIMPFLRIDIRIE